MQRYQCQQWCCDVAIEYISILFIFRRLYETNFMRIEKPFGIFAQTLDRRVGSFLSVSRFTFIFSIDEQTMNIQIHILLDGTMCTSKKVWFYARQQKKAVYQSSRTFCKCTLYTALFRWSHHQFLSQTESEIQWKVKKKTRKKQNFIRTDWVADVFNKTENTVIHITMKSVGYILFTNVNFSRHPNIQPWVLFDGSCHA